MQPMNKEEAERFLEEHPKPWKEECNSDWDGSIFISYDDNRNTDMNLTNLLRYVAYLEKKEIGISPSQEVILNEN